MATIEKNKVKKTDWPPKPFIAYKGTIATIVFCCSLIIINNTVGSASVTAGIAHTNNEKQTDMQTTTQNEVKEIQWPGKTFVIARATIAFDKLTDFFGEKYGAIYGAIYQMGLQATDPPCAIYYSINETTMETDLAAAVPLSGNVPAVPGFDMLTIPAGKAVTATHYGSYDSMTVTYTLLEKYMTEHDLKRKWIVEEYLSDPAVEKDPANWKTNIYFIIE